MHKYSFILRGIPGSGKSTAAKIIAAAFPNYAIHSTDDLCMVDGEYQFDVALAGERHAQNLQNFTDSCAAGKPCVIVDNTNVKTGQYHPYIQAACHYGYRTVIVELPHPAPAIAAQRNTHGVPIEVINQMVLDWEPSQHCVTVAKVNHAAEIVEKLQKTTRASVLVGFLGGVALCTLGKLLFWLLG